jgi:plasmid stabilization system protein ParE
MARPRFTTEAWRDLDEIVRYVGARNPVAASRLVDREIFDRAAALNRGKHIPAANPEHV